MISAAQVAKQPVPWISPRVLKFVVGTAIWKLKRKSMKPPPLWLRTVPMPIISSRDAWAASDPVKKPIEIHYCGVPVVKLFWWYLSCKSSAGACWFWKMVCSWDLNGFQVMWCSCWRRSRFPFPDKCWGQLLSRPLSGPCESFRECRREIQSPPINFISELCPVSSCTEISGMLKAIKWHLVPSFQGQVAVTLKHKVIPLWGWETWWIPGCMMSVCQAW